MLRKITQDKSAPSGAKSANLAFITVQKHTQIPVSTIKVVPLFYAGREAKLHSDMFSFFPNFEVCPSHFPKSSFFSLYLS